MSPFTRKWIVGVLVLALVAAVSSWWIARHEEALCRRAGPCDTFSPAPDLGLTPDQSREIALLERAYRAQVQELCAKHCAARARVARHLAVPNPPRQPLLSCAKEAGEAYSDLEMATLRHVLEVGDRLTPDQRARYFASMAGCLGAQCARTGAMAPVSPGTPSSQPKP